jgi:hypothetical protein
MVHGSIPVCSIISQAASPWPNLSPFNTAACDVIHSPLANPEDVGSNAAVEVYNFSSLGCNFD